MKKNYFILSILAILCLCTSVFAQTIRRCNNNAGITGLNVYTTIQAAHDAASDGDIIYVEPSNDDYGHLNSSKRLTIIGNGYFLDQNTNTPFNKLSSRIGNITFGAGSALTKLIGVIATGVSLQADNITVSRCYLKSNGINYISGNNCIISNCFMTSTINNGTGLNTIINGNIIFQPEQWAITNMKNAAIINNIIYSQVTGYFGSGNPIPAPIQNSDNCTISNNIFDFRDAGVNAQALGCGNSPCLNNNSVSNNICLTRNGLPAGNGNINGASATTTFQVTNPWDGYSIYNKNFTQDAIFQLAVGSPAIGIGTGGTNAGAFGGANPYVLSGLPPVPITTKYDVTGAGNTNVPIQVSVTVRSNN